MPTNLKSQHIFTEGDVIHVLENPPKNTNNGGVSDVLDETRSTFAMIDIASPDFPEVKVPFTKIAHKSSRGNHTQDSNSNISKEISESENESEIPANTPSIGMPNEDDPFDLDFTQSNPEFTSNEGIKDKAVLVQGLEELKGTLEGILPNFLHSKEREDIMLDIATQEANWDKMELKDVVIKKKEVSMWSEILNSVKESDFIPQKTVTTLERGEILELVIKGFESFRIVKIRTVDKDGYSMSVIQFTVEDPKNKDPKNKKYITVKGSYVMRLPLVKGGTISLLNTKMDCIASHEIEGIYLNKQQGSLLKGFFKLFS
ncbi:MAG: hypothetical protein PHQ95_02430 [Candidatus Gracilibacteria bacterium]|nr:hypothetical protein [Candidatus Gracilibacteria bacterium]